MHYEIESYIHLLLHRRAGSTAYVRLGMRQQRFAGRGPLPSITTAPNADCKIDVKAQEIAGEEVLATVTLLNETVDIASVTYNDKPCDPVSEGGGILCSRIVSPCPMRM